MHIFGFVEEIRAMGFFRKRKSEDKVGDM